MKEKSIRAVYNEETITVYQAYHKEIATAAVAAQTFISPPFKMERMTWIKPSFLWMMYRSGWATKLNQEHILAIQIKKEGFNWALNNACLSHFDANIHSSYEDWNTKLKAAPVRIQWDPERDFLLNKLSYRSLQMGLSKEAVDLYVNDWIVQIKDITTLCKKIHQHLQNGEIQKATQLLPNEKKYEL